MVILNFIQILIEYSVSKYLSDQTPRSGYALFSDGPIKGAPARLKWDKMCTQEFNCETLILF